VPSEPGEPGPRRADALRRELIAILLLYLAIAILPILLGIAAT
jgi:hypothetical protein